MVPSVQRVLAQIEEDGRSHDHQEPEHSKRWLNLEPDTAKLLCILLKLAQVRRVLEIGTSTGYSTICIAEVLRKQGGLLTTVERNAQKQAKAKSNVDELGLSGYVDWSLGDATEIVAELAGPFDCVFFDADRVSAPRQLDLLLPKLSHPTLLLADNAISHPTEIREYLDRVDGLPDVSHVIVPIGKGLSVAYLP
jgi:predicted O-methyltransferase YrrM